MKTINELDSYLAKSLAGFVMDPPDSGHQNGWLEATKQVNRAFFWRRDENGIRREPCDPSTLKKYLTGVLIHLPAPSADTAFEYGYRCCMEEIYKVFCMPKYTSEPLDYDLLRGAA